MIEKEKTYRTRSGREWRFYANDGRPPYPLHGAILMPDGWRGTYHTADGRVSLLSDDNPDDLIEVKPEITGWVNVYRGSMYPIIGRLFPDKKSALESRVVSPTNCIATIEFPPFHEGDGL